VDRNQTNTNAFHIDEFYQVAQFQINIELSYRIAAFE